MGSKSKSKATLIKGYTPIQLSIPTHKNQNEENSTNLKSSTTSFMYVKEHKQNTLSKSLSSSATSLFVVNAPMIPKIFTHIFLHHLFSQFGEVEKVTVIQNPREKNANNSLEQNEPMNEIKQILWSEKTSQVHPCPNLFGFQQNKYDEGKFAHIIFPSSKELKRTLQTIQKMNCSIAITSSDLSTLMAESKNLFESQSKSKDDDSDSSDKEEEEDSARISIVARLANRRRQNIIPRAVLMERCNDAMEQFELAEENSRKAKLAAASAPDEDGFVTVSYSNAVGSKREMEEDNTTFSKDMLDRRRKGNKRSRKKKDGDVVSGSSELKDFYRFQMRETRKKNIEQLRQKFEEDLKAVKKMKDQKRYRPFS